MKSCQIPHRLELTTDGAVTTWTMAVRFDPDDTSRDACDSDAINAVLSDSDHLRIVIESGTFVSATGFKTLGPDTVELEDVDSDTIKKNDGVLTFSLTWKREAR